MTWSTANSSVATVSSNGLARGVGEGTAAITATVSAVSGSQNISVECSVRTTVEMDPGSSATYDATACLLLPSGVSGDRYRVAVIRPSESENASDVTTATVPAQVTGKRDGTVFVKNFERRQQTARVHAILRQRERDMGFSKATLLPDAPLLAPALRADPPATRQINTTSTCSGEKQPYSLVVFNVISRSIKTTPARPSMYHLPTSCSTTIRRT